MILTDQEMAELRLEIESYSGLDPELLKRCGPFIRSGDLSQAIRSAFILLEERLREAVKEKDKTGTMLAILAFDPDKGVLTKRLGKTKSERIGLHNLFTGAFRLFRNPTAHNFIEYSIHEGKAIIYFVNLLLMILRQAVEQPSLETFIEPVEQAIEMIDQEIGPDVASRLSAFLDKCLKQGFQSVWAKNKLPFRLYAIQDLPQWDKPKPHPLPVFYIIPGRTNSGISFPINQYYKRVVGLDINPIARKLQELGFVPTGDWSDYRLNLRDKNDQVFFNELFNLVIQIKVALATTL